MPKADGGRSSVSVAIVGIDADSETFAQCSGRLSNAVAGAATKVAAPVVQPHHTRPAGLAGGSLRHPQHTEGPAKEVHTGGRSSALRTESCASTSRQGKHPVAIGERDLRAHTAAGAAASTHHRSTGRPTRNWRFNVRTLDGRAGRRRRRHCRIPACPGHPLPHSAG